MADYIFKVCLHTEKVKSAEDDIPVSEYTFILPSFYFTLNEYVNHRALINIPNSLLSCIGANSYYTSGSMGGEGSEKSYLAVINNNVVDTIAMTMGNKALVQGSETQYSWAVGRPSWFMYNPSRVVLA